MATASRTEASSVDRWRRLRPELILLDIMLPGITGMEVCRTVRRDDQVPVIMLTARTDPIDIVLALESGADDYVTKPFETRVLLARIRAVLRRHTQEPGDRLMHFGDLAIDPTGMTVAKGGRELALTPTELRLLMELARHAGQVLSRSVLLERVWDYTYLGDSRLVDVCVQRLRAKVEDDATSHRLIRTVRGLGYKLAAQP